MSRPTRYEFKAYAKWKAELRILLEQDGGYHTDSANDSAWNLYWEAQYSPAEALKADAGGGG